MSEPASRPNDFLERVRRSIERDKRAREEGEPSFTQQLGKIGVLGWIVVTPALIGLFGGRWLDRYFSSGIFWSAGLLVLGIAIGFWSAWRWMHSQ